MLGSDTAPSCILQLLGTGIPPGSSVRGILQAGILEWVDIPFSRGSSQPRNRPRVSCIAGRLFIVWAITEAPTGTLYSLFQKSYQSNCQGSYECPRFSEIRRLRQVRLLWEGQLPSLRTCRRFTASRAPHPGKGPLALHPLQFLLEWRSWACVSTWRGAQEEICKQWPKTATPVAAASPGWDWHVWYRLAWHDFRRAAASLYGGWQMHWSRKTDGQTGENTGKTLLTAALGLGVTTSLTSPLTTSSCPLLYPLHPPFLRSHRVPNTSPHSTLTLTTLVCTFHLREVCSDFWAISCMAHVKTVLQRLSIQVLSDFLARSICLLLSCLASHYILVPDMQKVLN